MIKMTICAGRRAELTHAEFRQYVTRVHGPLVASITEVAADLPAYHYNFPVVGGTGTLTGLSPATFDIVTQSWFDSIEAQRANMRHPRYLQVIRPDEGRYADEAHAVMHYMTEHRISAQAPMPAAPAPFKLLYLRRRRHGLTCEEFQDAWRQRPGPVLAHLAGASLGYVPNHAVAEAEHPDGGDPKYYDVIDEIALDSPGALQTLGHDAQAFTQLRALEVDYLDTAPSRALVTETQVSLPWGRRT